jgi:hypothetical protein
VWSTKDKPQPLLYERHQCYAAAIRLCASALQERFIYTNSGTHASEHVVVCQYVNLPENSDAALRDRLTHDVR